MKDKLPKEIVLGPNSTLPVVQCDLQTKLGCLDTKTGRIVIKKKQPKAGKHSILLHELIHLVAEHLKDEGIIKRQPDENFVTHLAGGLFPMLVFSGLWKGVSKKEMKKFLRSTKHDR
jgi:hypothetical protein